MSKLFAILVFYYSCSPKVYAIFRPGPNSHRENPSSAPSTPVGRGEPGEQLRGPPSYNNEVTQDLRGGGDLFYRGWQAQ